MRHLLFAVVCASSALTGGLTASPLADTLGPGFMTEGTRSIGPSDAYATLTNGDRIVFDGTIITRTADDGTLLATLATLPAFVFPAFVLPDPTEGYALVVESTTGIWYRVDLNVGGALPLLDLDQSYDAVFEDASHVLVSAAPCGFNCGSEIYRVDVSTGSASLVASLTGPDAGPSGPLSLAANGDLYYGQQPRFAPPPGNYSILRWTQAQITSGTVLDIPDAAVFASGLDGGFSMRFDNVYGHLFYAESIFVGPSRVLEFKPDGSLFDTVVTSANWLSNIELESGHGAGSFQAFQPDGVKLRYRSTDFTQFTSEIDRVRPVRPVMTLSGPGLNGPGPVTIDVTGAALGGSFLVLIAQSSSYALPEDVSDTGTFLFFTGMHGIRRTGLFVPTDVSGNGTFTFINPGTLQGTRVLQGVVRRASGPFVGTTTAAFL